MDTKLNINAIEELSIPVTKLKDPENLTTGFANDLTGRNEATIEEFTFRPSAGHKSIRDDSATIKRIKGNSIVWNQLSQVFPKDYTRSAHGVSATNVFGTHYIECSGTTTAIEGDNNIYVDSDITPKVNGVSGHKYIFLVEGCENLQINLYSFVSPSKQITNGETIVTCTGNSPIRYSVLIPTSTPVGTTINEKIRVLYIDLTQMFGAGNEPDTVEEFRALFPGNHYEYNPGQLVSMTANSLFTNGFNQWDEEWELGYLNADGTTAGYAQNYIRAKNYIPVISGVKYYAKLPNGVSDAQLYAVDENYNLIEPIYLWGNNQFFIPDGAAYIRFYMNYGSEVYNNDICINLSHTGVENGKYEPYWDATKDLSIIQKYFPNGMRSAGSIYDEISFDETTQKWVAIQRVGNVDLGTLTWTYSNNEFISLSIESLMTYPATSIDTGNILCSKYSSHPYNGSSLLDKAIFTSWQTAQLKAIWIKDSTYSDAASFKIAMSGVILNYELAEPIITVIEEPVNLSYKVGDFGIEQTLSDSFSAPFRADIIYQFNATDRIRENSLNIEKLSKTRNEYLLLAGGTMSGQINSQDIKPVEDSTYQLGDSTHKYNNVFSDFFTGDLEGNAKTATDLTGRIEATPEVFTYHPSAGEKSIKDNNAFISRVKGNSVVWNQLVKNGNFSTTTDWSPYQSANVSLNWDNGLTVTSNYAGTGADQISVRQAIAQPFILGHKYFVHFEFSTSNTSLTPLVECFGALYSNENKLDYVQNGNHYYSINNVKATRTTYCYLKAIGTKAVGDTWTFKNVMIIDLTTMFGAGNEPTTVEEFRALYPDSYYPHNTGELRNLDCSGIKTVGFNQWDEQWESGAYSYWTNGTKSDHPEYIRSTNFIKVIPANTYCLNIAAGVDAQVGFYDENNNFLGQASFSYSNNSRLFQVPTNCQKITFYTKATTYNNDICINLSHTGYRNGEYEPYKEVTHSMSVSQITNGEPLRKARNVYDEINETEYIKRVGVVDLGSLTYRKSDNFPNLFISNPFGAAGANEKEIANLFCPKYITMTAYDPWKDIISMGMDTSNQLYIYDPQYTDIEAFKSAMSGIMLNYELAEPIVTPIETPIDFSYYVEDFGTEEALLAEDSAPFSADIIYQFNATDTIRVLEKNIKQLLNKITSLENIIANAITNSNNL